MLDLYFFNKYIVRYILILKKSELKFHYTDIINFNKIVIYFNMNNIIDLNHFSILNYIYFFRYYFSVIPYYTQYSHRFHLNINYYSFFIQYEFFNKKLYYSLYFFINDIYYMINKTFLKLCIDD